MKIDQKVVITLLLVLVAGFVLFQSPVSQNDQTGRDELEEAPLQVNSGEIAPKNIDSGSVVTPLDIDVTPLVSVIDWV